MSTFVYKVNSCIASTTNLTNHNPDKQNAKISSLFNPRQQKRVKADNHDQKTKKETLENPKKRGT